MEGYYGVGAIAVICVLILFMGMMKQKTQAFTTFILRAFVGAIGIYAVNGILLSKGAAMVPGINPVTVLTVGSLGISGLGLLYGISAFGIL